MYISCGRVGNVRDDLVALPLFDTQHSVLVSPPDAQRSAAPEVRDGYPTVGVSGAQERPSRARRAWGCREDEAKGVDLSGVVSEDIERDRGRRGHGGRCSLTRSRQM